MYELTMSLNPKSKTPLYEQIYEFIKEEIQNNVIQSGERLPSTRALSKHLVVSRSTVELAYEQLLSEGYVEAIPCKGYFVAKIEGIYQLQKRPEIKVEPISSGVTEYAYDFTPNGVDLNSFPYNIWRKLSKECLIDDKAEMFRLGNPQGEYGLRNVISSYLHQARGIHCHPDQIIIGAGSDYLLMLLTTVIGNGHKVALENPTYGQAYRLFERLSYKVCTVDMDQSGMRIDELEKSGADIAFVMPSHQYPTGLVTSIARRYALLSWAAERPGRYLIEDDFDCEFRLAGKPIPALASIDAAQSVIYTNTFSKSLSSALRLAYMVLPDELMERFRCNLGFYASSVSSVDQVALARLLESGDYERHVNRVRVRAREARDGLMALVRKAFPAGEVSIEHADAGLYCTVVAERGTGGSSFVRALTRSSIPFVDISDCYWCADGASVPENSSQILVQYDDLSPKALNTLESQLMGALCNLSE